MPDYRKYQKEDSERADKSEKASKNTTYKPLASFSKAGQKAENDAYSAIRNIHDSSAQDAKESAQRNSDKAARPPMSKKWIEK